MALLWFLVALVIIFAILGGVAVNNWLWLLLVIALVLVPRRSPLALGGSRPSMVKGTGPP
jgi:hypothetical protein